VTRKRKGEREVGQKRKQWNVNAEESERDGIEWREGARIHNVHPIRGSERAHQSTGSCKSTTRQRRDVLAAGGTLRDYIHEQTPKFEYSLPLLYPNSSPGHTYALRGFAISTGGAVLVCIAESGRLLKMKGDGRER